MTSSTASAHKHVQPATPDVVIDVARFAANVDVARLDPAVITAVKSNIGDTLSCALAGSSAKAIDVVSGLVREWAGTPQADMFVFGGKFPAHHAAWVNGGMSHARDYDTRMTARPTSGRSTVPAAIAAGQLRGRWPGADLIAAVAAYSR
jgi:2-methylcitrate dehydratase PrpD